MLAQITGPVAVQGGLTSEWAASHVIDRLRRSGVVAYENPADARRDSVYAVPLFVEVNSLHIDDSVFYVWQLSLKLSDTVDFSDGSNHYVDVWSSGTHGYGGSKAVVSQVSTVLDQYTDQFAIDLLKARQP